MLRHYQVYIKLEEWKQFGHIGAFTGYWPGGLNKQDVVEGNREVDGNHQTLLRLPCNWSQFAADGAIWRKAIYRLELMIPKGDS